MNSGSLAMQQIVTLAAGLIMPRAMLLAYGSEVNGLVTSITQFVTYINLVEAGLSGATTYALYKPLADRDHDAISGVVSAAYKFYLQASAIVMALVCVLAVAYPLYIQSESMSALEMGLLVVCIGANGALEFSTLAKYRVLLTADQKTYIVSMGTIVYTILNTLIVVGLAYAGVSVVVMKAVALTAMWVRSLILMIYCRRHYKNLNYKAKPNTKALNKRWDALFLQILGVIHRGAPSLLITVILKDLKLVSVYTVFNMVTSGMNNVMNIFKTGVSASFGEVIARKEVQTLQKAYGEFEFMFYKLIAVAYSTCVVMIMPFINIYTRGITDVNYNLPLVGFLFAVDGIFYSLKTPGGMLFIAAGMYRETRVQTIIEGLIMVVGGAILAKPMGITGILLASVLSNLYRAIELAFFVPHNITKAAVSGTFRKILMMLLTIGISVAPFWFIKISADNYLQWAVCSMGVVAYTALVTLTIGFLFEKDDMKSVLRRIKRILKR